MNDDLVYSDDLGCAFLTAIVSSFEARHAQQFLGRTAMQKLAYFIKVLGVPIPYTFGIYTYGPYSDRVTFSMESLLADEVIEDRSTKPQYSNYRIGHNGSLLLKEFMLEIDPFKDRIDRAVGALGAFKPNELELIATLHFIAERQARTEGTSSKHSVIREFKEIKRNKFEEAEISSWYDALVNAGLIQSAVSGSAC